MDRNGLSVYNFLLFCAAQSLWGYYWGGFLRWLAALLPLQKGWHFVCRFGVSFNAALSSNRVAHNGLRVGDVALCCACGKAILLTRCYHQCYLIFNLLIIKL
jgi:hypothetical protein